MEIPVLPADGESVEEVEVVQDHPSYRPPNGHWICRCGTGNKPDAPACISWGCGYLDRNSPYQVSGTFPPDEEE